jgi:hypothetical protein
LPLASTRVLPIELLHFLTPEPVETTVPLSYRTPPKLALNRPSHGQMIGRLQLNTRMTIATMGMREAHNDGSHKRVTGRFLVSTFGGAAPVAQQPRSPQ